MPPQVLFTIDERSQVGSARRAATELALSLEFDETQTGKLGIAVTECATNIVKHAGTGRLLLRELTAAGVFGVEVLALDKGPGIADVAASLRDGHSTSGTMGSGLGALSRLSESFEIFTQAGRGTAMRLEIWAAARPPHPTPIEYGGVCLPKAGELVSGDNWGIEAFRDQITVLVADGLGHGIEAGDASRAALDTLAAHPRYEPQALIEACHAAMARTRGAAVSVAKLVASGDRGSYAGVGNIVGRIEGSTANRHLVSHNGTVGHVLRKVQEFAFPWPKGALLILHSDGLGTHWDLSAYPGLAGRHPALIAGVLYRDYDRGRDDVSVVVLRNCGESVE
ncbi:MAG: ATP-binding SpoIIE family protein phosphatase [Gammaproteobacteria bacterium]